MKKILFLHSGKASLPEISAYKKYFENNKEISFFNSVELKNYKLKDFDLIWRFMGVDFFSVDVPVIHEYASLSIGNLAKFKDYIKKTMNVIPRFRIFLNKNIQKQYGFNDNIKSVYRDMGISKQFFVKNNTKNFDFLYVGNMNSDRNISIVLDRFAHVLIGQSILLIGEPDNDLYLKYRKYKNIIFSGEVKYEKVPELASQAEYAINYIPNKYPYHLQTSTKLLEYVAMGLKVITTNYQWVCQFEQSRNMQFFKISEDLHELDIKNLDKFQFVNKSIVDLEWNNIIKNSGIESEFKKIFN